MVDDYFAWYEDANVAKDDLIAMLNKVKRRVPGRPAGSRVVNAHGWVVWHTRSTGEGPALLPNWVATAGLAIATRGVQKSLAATTLLRLLQGPVVVYVNAVVLQDYVSGILKTAECEPDSNHGGRGLGLCTSPHWQQQLGLQRRL